jgi:hypothetical protein
MSNNDDMTKLIDLLQLDGLNFAILANYCKVAYRMNLNPIPSIRKYLTNSGVHIPVHYIDMKRDMRSVDIINRVCGRAVPLILVIAKKSEGYCVEVTMKCVAPNDWDHTDEVVHYL